MAAPMSLFSDDTHGLFDHAASIADAPLDSINPETEFTEVEHHAIDYLGEHGLELVEFDAKRLIFSLPEDITPGDSDIILKLARHGDDSRSGHDLNTTEQTVWAEADAAVQSHLAPVLDAGDDGTWIAMPATDDATSDAMDTVRAVADEQGWDVASIESDDVGILSHESEEEKPVLHNYGHIAE